MGRREGVARCYGRVTPQPVARREAAVKRIFLIKNRTHHYDLQTEAKLAGGFLPGWPGSMSISRRGGPMNNWEAQDFRGNVTRVTMGA